MADSTASSDGKVSIEHCDAANVHYEGDLAIYTDPESKYQFCWNAEKNEWIARTEHKYGFEDDTHTYTDSDGVKFFWDNEKSAWFPKLNDEFMAQYQLNYGFVENEEKQEKSLPPPKADLPPPIPKLPKGMKRKASTPSWFQPDEQKISQVYVSNLPLTITEDEFAELMQKYGIIMRDPSTNQLKIKMYRDAVSNDFKGDALCTYIRRESVDLALKLLDGMDYNGSTIKVEVATFQMKGDYDPKLKPRAKKRKEKMNLKRQQEKLFDWRPEKKIGSRSKHERCVVLKNVFDPNEFDEDVGLILTIQDELRALCGQNGNVRKAIVYDRHPEGVVQVIMKTPEDADAVIDAVHQTYFRKRLMMAETWDGKTKFQIAETDAEISNRMQKWDKFLETDESVEKTNENEDSDCIQGNI